MTYASFGIHPCNIVNDLIIENKSTNLFRKLLLYPTELRDHSFIVIFEPIVKRIKILLNIPSTSLIFPNLPNAGRGKHGETTFIFSNLSSKEFIKNTNKIMASWGNIFMAKRFTDTGIWDKAWFRKMPPRLKEAWRYLCDKCDHAGIWPVDIEALSFNVGELVTLEEMALAFGDRIRLLGNDKVFVSRFIEFQYKCSVEKLNPENKVHLSVIQRLKNLNVIQTISSPMQGAKDKDKEQDREKDKDISAVFKFENRNKFDLDELFNTYPRVQKKTLSLDMLSALVSDQLIYDELKTAIKRYSDDCQNKGTEAAHILTFPNFLAEWRDWLDPKAGTSKLPDANKPRPIAELLAEKKRGLG